MGGDGNPPRRGCRYARLTLAASLALFVWAVVSRSGDAPPPSTSRWRGNNYVLDPSLVRADGRYVGVLPWQRCNASQFHPGSSRLFASFPHEGAAYDLAATALSIWGGADATGKPDRTSPLTAELLVFFGLSGKPCRPVHFNHCAVALTRPRVKCRPVGATEWAEGATVLITEWPPPPEGPIQNVESTTAATLTCPLDASFVLADSFELEFIVGDDPNDPHARLLVDACYEHVATPDILTICTEPHYGFNATGKFWNAVPPYPHDSTLLDAFIVYHTRIMSARVVFSDYFSNSHAYMAEHYSRHRDVEYRSEWVLDPRPAFHNAQRDVSLDLETFAETTCMWEQRIRSRWFMILHSADNFIFPIHLGESLSDVLARVDPRQYSELKVPYQQMFSPPNATPASQVGRNILQRFNLVGPSVEALDFRETPLGNPRHFTFSVVHWLGYGARPEFTHAMPSQEVYDLLGINTAHFMGLTRPSWDEHAGEKSPQLDRLGDLLATALEERLHGGGRAPELVGLMARPVLSASRAQIDVAVVSLLLLFLLLRLRRAAASRLVTLVQCQ